MGAQVVIPIIASILILGTLGIQNAFASEIIVPNSLETTEGDVRNAFPFFANDPNGSTYQQVYSSSEFSAATEPGIITSISFRLDESAGVVSLTITDLKIFLSTTNASPDSLSATFADNVGPDETLVFDGSLSISSVSVSVPNPFDTVIVFQNPFPYDPTQGDLLLEVNNISGEGFIALKHFDAESTIGDGTSRVFQFGFQDINEPVGNLDSVGLVTSFEIVTDEDALNDLIAEIEGLGLSKPSEKSLTQKLNAAIKFLTDKNEKNDLNSCNKLNDFINLVNAQEGKGLTTPQADSLRDSADSIKTSIGCPDTPPPPGCPNPSHLGFVFEGEITSISDPGNLLGGIIAEGETWSTFYCLDKKTPDTNPSTAFQYEIDFIAITIGDNDEFVCTDPEFPQILQIESGATFGTYQVFCVGMTPPVLPPSAQSFFNIFLGTSNAGLLDGSIPKFAPDLNDFDLGVLLIWNIEDFSNESEVTGTITSFVKVQ